MEIGQRLRKIRKSKGVTMQQVAEKSDLSKSFISQIEAGTANPSVASLKKIANVLGTPLAALFEGDPNLPGEDSRNGNGASGKATSEDVSVVRRDRRKTLGWPGLAGQAYLLTPDLRGKLEVVLSVLEPGDSSGDDFYSHEGEELGLVLEGRYEVVFPDQSFMLEEGDSICFPSNLPHKTRVVGDKRVQTIWVITPPSF